MGISILFSSVTRDMQVLSKMTLLGIMYGIIRILIARDDFDRYIMTMFVTLFPKRLHS